MTRELPFQVNDVSVVNVSHSIAVEALKKAGNRVVLQIKRKLANAEPRDGFFSQVCLISNQIWTGFHRI